MNHNIRTLVLNSTFRPLSIVNPNRCISLLIRSKLTSVVDSSMEFRSEKESFLIPKVAILTYYVKAPYARRIALNKENVFIRDNYICQYCSSSAESIDHIIPKSKGGGHDWGNIVACCKTCNLKKADKLLHEINLSLIKNPRLPNDNFWIKALLNSSPDPSWEKYLLTA